MDELRPGHGQRGARGGRARRPRAVPVRRRAAGEDGRPLHRPPSSTCSPSTASCTSSATTTPSRRSTRRCSASRASCWRSGRPRRPRRRTAGEPMTATVRPARWWQWPSSCSPALFSAAEAALGGVLPRPRRGARRQGRPGARRLLRAARRPAALPQHRAVAAAALRDRAVGAGHARWSSTPARRPRWPTVLTAIGVMLLVLVRGRSASARAPSAASTPSGSRCVAAAPLALREPRSSGPIPQLLILIGNAITPGKGFREGPFSTEAELRELVDLAEASARDRVRRAQDDPLGLRARRHHRARGDGPAHRRRLHRAPQEPAPDDVAVPAQRLLPHPGDRREPRRHRRLRLPQGPRPPRLRGARRPSSPSASTR